jgi:hypothetical protein
MRKDMELALRRTGDQVTIGRNLFHGCDENGLALPHTATAASSCIGAALPALISIKDLQY